MKGFFYWNIILVSSLVFLNPVFAQNEQFKEIDKHATSVPLTISEDIDLLCAYLVKPANNDTQKLRSIYVWIAHNIKYDMKGFIAEKLPPYDVASVFKSRMGVCLGMANLLEAMCRKVNIYAPVIDGYSKGFGYIDGTKFTIPDHAWNAVKINDQWYHLDVTWDIVSTNLPKFYPDRKFTGDFFLVPSDEFIVNHLSSDPVWQLSNYILPLSDFEKADESTEKIIFPKTNYISFNDTLEAFQKLDSINALIDYARRASDFNPLNSEAKIQLALGYFYKGDLLVEEIKKISAEEYHKNYKQYESRINFYYEYAYQVFTDVKPGMKYYAEAKEAAEEIREYIIKTDINHKTTTEENYQVNHNLKVKMLDRNISLDIHKLDVLNSSNRETNLSISPDGNLLFFKSDRGGQPWSEKYRKFKGKVIYDGDIWYSRKMDGVWSKPYLP